MRNRLFLVNNFMRYWFVILLLPLSAWANLDDCARLHGYEQDLCFAVAKLDIRRCEQIHNLTIRENCTRAVVDEQRRVLNLPRPDQKR